MPSLAGKEQPQLVLLTLKVSWVSSSGGPHSIPAGTGLFSLPSALWPHVSGPSPFLGSGDPSKAVAMEHEAFGALAFSSASWDLSAVLPAPAPEDKHLTVLLKPRSSPGPIVKPLSVAVTPAAAVGLSPGAAAGDVGSSGGPPSLSVLTSDVTSLTLKFHVPTGETATTGQEGRQSAATAAPGLPVCSSPRQEGTGPTVSPASPGPLPPVPATLLELRLVIQRVEVSPFSLAACWKAQQGLLFGTPRNMLSNLGLHSADFCFESSFSEEGEPRGEDGALLLQDEVAAELQRYVVPVPGAGPAYAADATEDPRFFKEGRRSLDSMGGSAPDSREGSPPPGGGEHGAASSSGGGALEGDALDAAAKELLLHKSASWGMDPIMQVPACQGGGGLVSAASLEARLKSPSSMKNTLSIKDLVAFGDSPEEDGEGDHWKAPGSRQHLRLPGAPGEGEGEGVQPLALDGPAEPSPAAAPKEATAEGQEEADGEAEAERSQSAEEQGAAPAKVFEKVHCPASADASLREEALSKADVPCQYASPLSPPVPLGAEEFSVRDGVFGKDARAQAKGAQEPKWRLYPLASPLRPLQEGNAVSALGQGGARGADEAAPGGSSEEGEKEAADATVELQREPSSAKDSLPAAEGAVAAAAVTERLLGSKERRRLAIVMVGLPARGKTFTAAKLTRYLRWLGHDTKHFNVGKYRRLKLGTSQTCEFFSAENKEGVDARNEVAQEAFLDMLGWMDGGGQVGVFDATNSTRERRSMLLHLAEGRCKVIFLECLCNDESIIDRNAREKIRASPDYAHSRGDAQEALRDFIMRLRNYEAVYEPVMEGSYIKLVNMVSGATGQMQINNISGYLPGRIVFFLLNTHITPRPVFLTRHGESLYNVMGRIGGDAALSERGEQYSGMLTEFLNKRLKHEKMASVWTSTLQRTILTARSIAPFPKVQWRALDEINAGVCDGMTYQEIKESMPDEYKARKADKLRYRYPRGESYLDVIQRLEPVIVELERQRHPVVVVAHQAVLRALYAYFMDKPLKEVPHIEMPLHTVIELTTGVSGIKEKRYKLMDAPSSP